MKKLMMALALAAMFAAPGALIAQEGGEWGEGNDGAERGKTPQEMMEELHRLMKKASDEMGGLEKELAKTSLDAPKADVIAERIRRIEEAMKEGRIDDLPEGLRKHIEENPEEAAEATGKSKSEIEEIARSSDKLEELLKKNPELLKKMAESQSTMESVREKQQAAEKKLEESLRKQQDSAESAKQKVDESLELAHTIQQQQQSQGQGQPQNDDSQKSQDPREQEEQQGSDQPNKGAEDQYQPGDGDRDNNKDEKEDFERGEGEGFQAEKQGKDMGEGSSSRDRSEPGKYKDFWEKFNREIKKKIDDRKDTDKSDE